MKKTQLIVCDLYGLLASDFLMFPYSDTAQQTKRFLNEIFFLRVFFRKVLARRRTSRLTLILLLMQRIFDAQDILGVTFVPICFVVPAVSDGVFGKSIKGSQFFKDHDKCPLVAK
jgi:hypothetical protein